MRINLAISAVLLTGVCHILGGAFQNLDFESGKLVPVPNSPTGSEFSFGYSARDALPGWRVFRDTDEIITVGYNSVVDSGLGGEFRIALALISNSFMDFQTHPSLVEGNYGFHFMQTHMTTWDYSISQRGLVPTDARFMQFRDVGNVIPYIDGVEIPLDFRNDEFIQELGSPDDPFHLFLVMVDVSKYAGREVEVKFGSLFDDRTYPYRHGFSIDSIKFVPEPRWIDPKKMRFTPEGVSFSWIGSIGAKFQVEARLDVNSEWQPLGSSVTSTNGVYSFTDAAAVSPNPPPQRFYQVTVVP